MSYALSFADRFFAPEGVDTVVPSERPTNLYQAIMSIEQETWRALALDIFGVVPERLDPEAVLRKAVETDTCDNLVSPVEVWIDPGGSHTVFVHDSADA